MGSIERRRREQAMGVRVHAPPGEILKFSFSKVHILRILREM